MITYSRGNLLEARVDALVNAVNTVGVMGKGIALTFKQRFPDNFVQYAAACRAGQVQIGKMFVTRVDESNGPKWIINFPTKQHWRDGSKLAWIVDGLADLHKVIIDTQISSIAIPALGAGLGGLPWEDVLNEIDRALGSLTDVDIQVFEPLVHD